MRRIAIALILAAAVVGIHACAADAPTAPKPGSGGGSNSTAVSVTLFTTNANPKAGSCTLIQAVVTLNGNAVPDGTTVNFTTDFGAFGQNGLPLVSIVTTGGSAVAALCGPSAGSAKVKGSATIAGKSNSATIGISFQADPNGGPHVSFCSPSFGPKEGGTVLTLTGGGFPGGAPSTVRAQFTANGITRDGVVTSVTSTTVVLQTPGFPELTAPTVPAAITLTFNATTPPTVLSLPSCFAYGAVDAGTPTVTAVLPASGTNEGKTRVTVIGSGFASTGVQVFFGTAEATIVSVSYNQVVVLSPPAFGAGQGNLNQQVPVTVKNIVSGVVSNATVIFSYTPAVRITSNDNGTQSIDHLTAVTIFGQGFEAPVAVTLAGIPAFVQSVSATEIVVLPSVPLVSGCANISGPVAVTNIDTGDSATGGGFTYVIPQMAITSIAPQSGQAGQSVVITGAHFPTSSADIQVTFGSHAAFLSGEPSPDGTGFTVIVPPGSTTTNPACTPPNVPPALQNTETVDIRVVNRVTGCEVTITQAFTYQLPCVAPTATPTPP